MIMDFERYATPGDTPGATLVRAAALGAIREVTALINGGAVTPADVTAAFAAAPENGQSGVYRKLLRAGADITGMQLSLRAAVRVGSTIILRRVIDAARHPPAEIAAALQVAHDMGRKDLVEMLLDVAGPADTASPPPAARAASPPPAAQIDGLDALAAAARSGNIERVRALVAAGADVRLHRDRALYFAYINRHDEIVHLLADEAERVAGRPLHVVFGDTRLLFAHERPLRHPRGPTGVPRAEKARF